MQAGRLIESGPTAAVFAEPREVYTAELLAATPDLTRAISNRTQRAA